MLKKHPVFPSANSVLCLFNTTNIHSITIRVSRFPRKFYLKSPSTVEPRNTRGRIIRAPFLLRKSVSFVAARREKAEARGEVAGRSITFSFPRVFRFRDGLPPSGTRWKTRWLRGWWLCHVLLARNIFCT